MEPEYWRMRLVGIIFLVTAGGAGFLLSQNIGLVGWLIGFFIGVFIAYGVGNFLDQYYEPDEMKRIRSEAENVTPLVRNNMERDRSKCPSCMSAIRSEDNHCVNCGFNLSKFKN